MDLVPIKVKIGLKPNGHHNFPDFNQLPSVAASGIDWSIYIDLNYKPAWLYSSCGHQEEEPGSPMGVWHGMILVPAVFATEAVSLFPAEVTQLSDAEATTFYDSDHALNFDEEILDDTVLQSIKAKQEIVPPIPLTPRQLKALDPTDDQPGVRPNVDKTFAGFKTRRGITVPP